MKQNYDEYAGSDDDSHDAYLERMKEEGKIREENANDSSEDSGEETGELFSRDREKLANLLKRLFAAAKTVPFFAFISHFCGFSFYR